MVLQGIGMRRGDLPPAPLLLNWPSLGTMKHMARGPENDNCSRCALALWSPKGGDVDRMEQKLLSECPLSLVRAAEKDG